MEHTEAFLVFMGFTAEVVVLYAGTFYGGLWLLERIFKVKT